MNIKTIRDDIASIKADLADGETTFEHAVECLTDAANTATDVADAEKARAYAAEAKVCELVEHIRRTEEALADGESPDGVWIPRENLPPRFSSTADIRAKWCPVSERDEVGVQLVAAQERLALAMETVDALSMTCLMWSRPDKIKEAKADVNFVRTALDAVPGDEGAALGTPFDEAGTTNPDKKGTQ